MNGEVYSIDLSFANIFNFLKIMRTTKNFTNRDFLNYFNLDFEIFKDKVQDIFNYITVERFINEPEKNKKGDLEFDLFEDFDLIFVNFKKYFNIDLFRDKLTWMEFNFYLLEDLLLSENSVTKRIEFRTHKINPKDDNEVNNFYRKMKKKYNINHKKTYNINELLKEKEALEIRLQKTMEEAEWD